MRNLSKKVVIVGVAESDEIGNVPDKSALQHHAEAAYNALEDAGLSKNDVDGLFTARFSTLTTAEYMGIQPSFTDSTWIGGGSFETHVGHALAAINAGYCEVALITHGQTGRSSRVSPLVDQFGLAHGTVSDSPDPNQPQTQYENPYGFIGAPAFYAVACTRYMYEFDEARTREGLAEIAVSTRKWANMNPRAMMRDKQMSFDDYHNSRWVVWPFHLFDCCLVTDAGGAVVLTTAERARTLRKKPVWVLGASECHEHGMISQMPSLTSLIARETGKKAMALAGITDKDIDHTMLYDAFTYMPLLSLEDLGFCGKGEAPDFLKGQRTAPDGDFPLNTNGGGLSYTHTGMYGIFMLVEAVRQLRGECGERQVPDCKVSLVNGVGGILSSCSTVILAAD